MFHARNVGCSTFTPDSGPGTRRSQIDSLAHANYHRHGKRVRLHKLGGMLGEREYDAIPTSRTIGISFVCLVTSACAIRTPEKNASHFPGEGAGTALRNAQLPTDGDRAASAA